MFRKLLDLIRKIPKDKLMHAGVNFGLALFCIWDYGLGIGLCIGASLGKVYGDSKSTGNHWCWWDLLADAIGMGLGILASWVIRKIIGR